MTASKSPSDPDTDIAGTAEGNAAGSGRGRVRLVGLAVAALALIATTVWDSEKLRESVFDKYQNHMPRVVESHPARIVEIDDASLRKYGPWPWSRHRLARLAEGIHARGARAIGFDMIFPEEDHHSPTNIVKNYPGLSDHIGKALAEHPHPDHTFAEVIARLPIVLGRAGHHDAEIDPTRHPAKIPIEASFKGHPPPSGLLTFGNVTTNLPKFDEAAAGHAVLNGPPDADGILRRVPLIVVVGGRPTPTMALEVLRVASNSDDYHLETKDGRLVAITMGKQRIPTDATGALRLHFSPPLAARTVSATAILDDSLPKDAFRGNVVLIGASALGLEDVIATPVTGEAFGVDVHAQLVETILTGHWLQRPHWARTAEIILAVILSLIAIVTLPSLQPKYVILSGAAVLMTLVGASYFAFARHGVLLDPIAPGIVSTVTTLSMLCIMFLAAEQRQRYLRKAFSLYLPDTVIDRMIKSDSQPALGGESKTLSVFFSDIQGFTTISESLPPPDLVRFLNRYLSVISDIIEQHGGFVDKYIGDAVVGVFGAPLEDSNHAINAVQAALACQRHLAEIQEQFDLPGNPLVATRIGLNTGEMLVGNIGSARRFNYTVMGDAVNLAARLEAANKFFQTSILISETTWQHCQDSTAPESQIAFREIDRVRVVGRGAPVSVFEPSTSQAYIAANGDYAAALGHYRAGRFPEATKRLNPWGSQGDKVAARLCERIEQLGAIPPADWNGVTSLESK